MERSHIADFRKICQTQRPVLGYPILLEDEQRRAQILPRNCRRNIFTGQGQRYPFQREKTHSLRARARVCMYMCMGRQIIVLQIADLVLWQRPVPRACTRVRVGRGIPVPWKQLPPQLRSHGIRFPRFVSSTSLRSVPSSSSPRLQSGTLENISPQFPTGNNIKYNYGRANYEYDF